MNENYIKFNSNFFIGDFSFNPFPNNLISIILEILKIVESRIVITQKDLLKELTIHPIKKVKESIDLLEKEILLKSIVVEENKIIALTHKGKGLINQYLEDTKMHESWRYKHHGSKISQFSQITPSKLPSIQKEDLEQLEYTPSFIGCFIADKSGKSLLVFELFKGAIENYLKIQNINQFDKELIPMMVSALEHFSREINIKQFNGLILQGENIKLQTFNYDIFTVTFLMNPNTNTKSIKKTMNDYFENLFKDYKDQLELSITTGLVENINHLNQLGREMLKELNKFVYLVEFKNIVNNLKNFDMAYAKTLYSKLDQLQRNLNLKFIVTIEKLKQLKIYLLKAMLDENLEELKFIITLVQEIESEFS